MAIDPIGYRFSPTKEELVNEYLKNKNLGKTWLVDHVIREINICSFEPKDLPALSKIKSDDLVWYFFLLKEYSDAKKTKMKRTAVNGFWKVTGPDVTIKDKRGSKIGIKKTLVYLEGKGATGVRTPWVIHEYHITYLPPNKTTYVLCQVKYKGELADISYGGNNSVVCHSDIAREINSVVNQPIEDGLYLNDLSYPLNVQEDLCPLDAINPNLLQQKPEIQVNQPVLNLNDLSNPLNIQEDLFPLDVINPNLVQQTPEVLEGLSLDDLEMLEHEQDNLPPPDAFDPDTFFNLPPQTPYWNELWANDGWNFEDVVCDQVIIRENRNVYMPMKALSGIIVDCSSDSDCRAESMSVMSYEGTAIPHDSVGSSNKHFPRCSISDSCKDLQTSAVLSVNRKSWEHQRTRHTVRSKKKVKRDKSKSKETSMVKTDKVKRDKPGDNETSMVKTEKKSCFIIKKEKPRYNYLMNMITVFILLVGLIGYIKS